MPGKRLDHNQQRFVVNLVAYFQKELENGAPLLPLTCIRERVANALGISVRTVGNCINRAIAAQNPEASNIKEEDTDSSSAEDPLAEVPPPQVIIKPKIKYQNTKYKSRFPYTPRKKLKTTDLPDTTKMEIRNMILQMHAEGKRVTLGTVNDELRLRDMVHIGKSSLGIILQQLGFNYKKQQNGLSWVLEKPEPEQGSTTDAPQIKTEPIELVDHTLDEQDKKVH